MWHQHRGDDDEETLPGRGLGSLRGGLFGKPVHQDPPWPLEAKWDGSSLKHQTTNLSQLGKHLCHQPAFTCTCARATLWSPHTGMPLGTFKYLELYQPAIPLTGTPTARKRGSGTAPFTNLVFFSSPEHLTLTLPSNMEPAELQMKVVFLKPLCKFYNICFWGIVYLLGTKVNLRLRVSSRQKLST